MEKFITAHETALRISDRGKGEDTILLLHGYLESLDIWNDMTEQLALRYRVVAIDLPGMGISQVKGEVHTMAFLADVAADVMQQLGIARYFVAGHSMGGYVALALADKYRERLNGLILLHASPNPDTEEKKEKRRREIELVRADKLDLIAKLFAPQGYAPENRKRLKDKIEEFEEVILVSDPRGVEAILNGLIERPDQNEMMHALPVPQLLVFGRLDEFIPVEAAETIIAAQPQAEVVWLETSGHVGFIEQQAETLAALEAFMERYSNSQS